MGCSVLSQNDVIQHTVDDGRQKAVKLKSMSNGKSAYIFTQSSGGYAKIC